MIKFLKSNWKLALIFLIALLIFWPSLFMFYANDDLFFLKISNIGGIGGFFNLIKGPDGFGIYRSLSTQVYYFLSWKLFNLNPLSLHIISFIFFFGVVYLIYRLVLELLSGRLKSEQASPIALISAFFYSVSASHFGQLYYLAAFQELEMTFFVLLSCIAFLKNRKLLSFIVFILGLLSKETAVVTPLLIGLIYLYQHDGKFNLKTFKKFFIFLTPFAIILIGYLFIRFKWYGFATGDSYIWNFSPKKFINTIFWYLLWSLNIPESLVDFIGPGMKINPNLFLYWGSQIIPILISFILQCLVLVFVLTKVLLDKSKKEIWKRNQVSVFFVVWFLIGILPVAFLPNHKFSFYLTLPLLGLVFRISYLLIASKINKFITRVFLVVWTLTSVLTLKFTYQTNWISQSEIAA